MIVLLKINTLLWSAKEENYKNKEIELWWHTPVKYIISLIPISDGNRYDKNFNQSKC